MPSRKVLSVSFVLLAAASTGTASAQSRLMWSEQWSRAHIASYPAVLLGMAGGLTFDLLYEPPDEPSWSGGVLFDDEARRALRLAGEDDRGFAADLSDVLLAVSLAWPLLDAGLVAGIVDQNSDVFVQLTMVAAQVLAADWILNTVVKGLAHRQRPNGQFCGVEEGASGSCRSRSLSDRTRSFYSGHTSAAFASAGVTCMAHAHLPLYVERAADIAACAGAMTLAGVIGLLRILADRHHASDVLVGAIVGAGIGTLLPWALQYGRRPADAEPSTETLRAIPIRFGYAGRF